MLRMLRAISVVLDCLLVLMELYNFVFILFSGESDNRDLANLEELVWDPCQSPDDKIIDSFLVIARYADYFMYLKKVCFDEFYFLFFLSQYILAMCVC